jgi:hypothetical protein
LSGSLASQILSVQPRQGTFCKWHAIGDLIENLINGEKNKGLASLMPTAQEVLCSEFLRSNIVNNYSIPRIESFLLPVGRTLKDIDILGLSKDDVIIAAQVTYLDFEALDAKIIKLKNYKEVKKCIKIMFCNCDDIIKRENIVYFPLEIVYEQYLKTDAGQRWVNNCI